MKHLPNTITLLNLFTGCIAVSLAFRDQLGSAALLIIVCAVLDFLDGTAARVLRAGSEMGKQLDSLADLIGFGLAPAAILFAYLSESSPLRIAGKDILPALIPYLAFLITVFSAIRLARFNLDTKQTVSFTGLPTPANALFLASIPLVLNLSENGRWISHIMKEITAYTPYMILLLALFSWLLIAPIRMFSLKFKSLKVRENINRYVFLALIIPLIFFLGWESTPLIIILYITLSLLEPLWLNHMKPEKKVNS